MVGEGRTAAEPPEAEEAEEAGAEVEEAGALMGRERVSMSDNKK